MGALGGAGNSNLKLFLNSLKYFMTILNCFQPLFYDIRYMDTSMLEKGVLTIIKDGYHNSSKVLCFHSRNKTKPYDTLS